METRPFQFTGRIRSFGHAIAGIIRMVRCQHNAWIHSVATVGVAVIGFYVELVRWEWCMLAFAIGLVWMAEALNTAIEFLADEVSLEKRELIGKAKDAASAGVLIAAICSVVIGLLVFVPHFLK